jgi:hypothetical protein
MDEKKDFRCVFVTLCLCVKTISKLPTFTFPCAALAAGYNNHCANEVLQVGLHSC